MTPAGRQSAAHWSAVAALVGAGAALWLAGLELAASAWCAAMAFTALAVVQIWRRIARPTLPGGEW